MSDKLIISGSRPLEGEVSISGAKNAVLKLMAAALLASDVSKIHNVPELTDVEIMLDVLECLGAKCNYDKTNKFVEIDAKNLTSVVASDKFVSKMRASFVVLGALVGRMKEAKVALPGGCKIGERRVNFHIKGLEALGAKCKIEQGYVHAKATQLRGADICLDIPSVGATENIMLAAVLAQGTTRIQNAAQEPEIVDLANFLKAMGAKIEGAGTNEISIYGVRQEDLHGVEYTTISDRIEAGTYMSIIIGSKGHGIIKNVFPNHLTIFTGKLLEMGAKIKLLEPNVMEVSSNSRLLPMNFITQPYPGFPTDLQSPLLVAMAQAEGESSLRETVFNGRFGVVEELNRMGAGIEVEKDTARVPGGRRLSGKRVRASELRGGAALVIAGLCAEGETLVENRSYVDRGYEDICRDLRFLGACVQDG